MGRILLVEDDPLIVQPLIRVMSDGGHEITHARNGLAAVELLSTQDFDVLVTDLMMARLDGQELCQWVRADSKLSTMPIVVTTGVVDPERLPWLADVQPIEVMTKPLKMATLLERIESCISG